MTSHYFLGGKEIAFRKGSTLEYLHTDHLGSTSVTTNTSGTTVSTVKYFPFGGARSQTGVLDTDKRFTGQRLDQTGLYYYGARYYDATIGRFISPDTIVPNPTNPQSLNRYSYCLNNPLRYVDPSGHFLSEAAERNLANIAAYMNGQPLPYNPLTGQPNTWPDATPTAGSGSSGSSGSTGGSGSTSGGSTTGSGTSVTGAGSVMPEATPNPPENRDRGVLGWCQDRFDNWFGKPARGALKDTQEWLDEKAEPARGLVVNVQEWADEKAEPIREWLHEWQAWADTHRQEVAIGLTFIALGIGGFGIGSFYATSAYLTGDVIGAYFWAGVAFDSAAVTLSGSDMAFDTDVSKFVPSR